MIRVQGTFRGDDIEVTWSDGLVDGPDLFLSELHALARQPEIDLSSLIELRLPSLHNQDEAGLMIESLFDDIEFSGFDLDPWKDTDVLPPTPEDRMLSLLVNWHDDEIGDKLSLQDISTEEALEVLEDMWDKQEENIAKHAVHDQKDHGNWADGTSDPDTPAWQRRLDAIPEAPRATSELRLSARLGNPEAKAALRAAGSWEAKQMIGNIQQTWTRNGEFAFIDEQPSRIFYLIDMKNDIEDDYLYWQKTDTDYLPKVERYLKQRGWSKL